MTNERCLYTLMYAPQERHDDVLRALVIPVVRDLRDAPELASLFFARYNQPEWQLRFRVLGRPEWVDGPVRKGVDDRLPDLRERGLVSGWEFAVYQREYERYGGEEGMRLAEKLFLHDTLACLDLLEAESKGLLERSRREWSLALTERFLDLLGVEGERRLAFYRKGYGWAVDSGEWSGDDLDVLENRYQSLKEGILDLMRPDATPEETFGGDEAARIARRFLEASRPVVEQVLRAHAAGELRQDLVDLAWSYAHMHCNRLGLDVPAEAILRFFMARLHEER